MILENMIDMTVGVMKGVPLDNVKVGLFSK